MTMRRLFLVLLLVGGFWFFITHGNLRTLGADGFGKSTLTLTEAHAAPEYTNAELNNISVYKRVVPSVVNITAGTVTLDFFYGMVPAEDQGSGFILDKQGHILTNYHVVANARKIEVQTYDKHRYTAQVIGSDKFHDLALLKIDGTNLTPAVLASSHDLQVGQQVYAIGNPFGLSGTMTAGIISAIRSVKGPEGSPIENAIQTDAAINPGNSGGPLLNSHGEVIGINSMIAQNGAEQNAGIGFAIPIDTAKAVLGDFQKYGHARRPSLGISILPIGPDLAQQMGLAASYGVLIESTTPGGAAERAGLRGGNQIAYLGNMQISTGGDLIVAIDGQEITNAQELSDFMNQHQPGDTITVTFYRGRNKTTVRVTLGEANERVT
ncbi:MAG TPA: trypsin-like peptidase domain-containing protein [Acidobacteriaceae bacterium]|jgi:S1-C subfamily serine protease|nr:trypsin-like peptidase domain-containing protein [Acidobacteriaceae bacterium]